MVPLAQVEPLSPARTDGLNRRDWFGAALAGAVVVAIGLLLAWHDPYFFWKDDFQLYYLPAFADIADAWRHGDFPLLSLRSWRLGNLAAESQFGVFSVFVNACVVSAFAAPLSLPLKAAALSLIHLFITASGAFVLARHRSLPPALAMMVALATSLNGWMICWAASNWFAALSSFAWLPWAWWALERALRGPRYRIAMAALFIYLLISAGRPLTVIMLAMVTVWIVLRSGVSGKRIREVWPLAASWILGAGLSAPMWMILLESQAWPRSTEAFIHYGWVVPLSALPALILPVFPAPWLIFVGPVMSHLSLELACGLAPAVVLLAALFAMPRQLWRRLRWEIGFLLLVFLLAATPSIGPFHWSFRWLILFHLLLALSAAEAARLWHEIAPANDRTWRNRGAWAAVAVLTSGGVAIALEADWLPSALCLFIGLTLLAVAWWIVERHLPRSIILWTLPAITGAALLMTYWSIGTGDTMRTFRFTDNLLKADPLDSSRLYLSLYHPWENYALGRYGNYGVGTLMRPGNTSMFAPLHFINGYSARTSDGVSQNLQLQKQGFVTPPVGFHLLANESGPDGWLSTLGVDGLITSSFYRNAVKALAPGWEPVARMNGQTVFHRLTKLPAVVALSETGELLPLLTSVEVQRHQVVVEVESAPPVALEDTGLAAPTNGSGFLVAFRRPWFPGYRATLNGTHLKVDLFHGIMPAVQIPPGGRGRLVLEYRPRSLTIGAIVAAGSALITLGIGFMALRPRA